MNDLPEFLINIRRTALARAYSADKNWSVFLGRPPRLGKKFCHLNAILRQSAGLEEEAHSPLGHHRDVLRWHAGSKMSVWAETRWTAACASLKEEILDIFSEEIRENLEERVWYVSYAHGLQRPSKLQLLIQNSKWSSAAG